MNENENERVGLNERARRLFARIGEFFGRLSRRTKIILAAIVLIAALCLSGAALAEEGPFRMRDCVSKKNTASLRTHLRAGFRIAAEEGQDLLTGDTYENDYSMEYEYAPQMD